MPDFPECQRFLEYTRAVAAFAAAKRHRQLLVLSGDCDWCRTLAVAAVNDCGTSVGGADKTRSGAGGIGAEAPILWIGETRPDNGPQLAAGQCVRRLGSESRMLVYDAFDGLNPDALAAISGTLRAGGLLLLLTPPLEQWPQFPDPDYQSSLVWPQSTDQAPSAFLRWFATAIETDAAVQVVRQHQPLPQPGAPGTMAQDGIGSALTAAEQTEATGPLSDASPVSRCCTPDQLSAVEAVIRVVTGHRRRPLVITADRGRGKSAALGIAAAALLKQNPCTILVTAPSSAAVESLFSIARACLELPDERAAVIEYAGGTLRFQPPDELLRQQYPAALLLVDEAAAIPAALLERLLQRYARIAFSTTVHGYEGSGRGFQIRFRQTLDRLTPDWRALRLSEAVRWAEGDPLERWIFSTLLLDAEVEVPAVADSFSARSCSSETLTGEELLACPTRLRQIFALLVQAHYRTTPGDLRDLFDGNNLRLQVLSFDGTVVAVLLTAREGGFDRPMAEAVWAGKRRPRGHLLPQILSAQSGWLEAAELSCSRVVRIAVLPELQGRGLGSRLLAQLREDAASGGIELLGSSFSASPGLLRFWRRNGFSVLRTGLSRDTSSGSHSMLVGSPVSERAGQLQRAVCQRFQHQLIDWLRGALAQLDTETVAELLRDRLPAQLSLDRQDELDLISFAWGQRGFEQTHLALSRMLSGGFWLATEGLETGSQTLLIACVLQGRRWSECAAIIAVPGRKQVEKRLRQILQRLLAEVDLSEPSASLLARLRPES